MWRPVGKVRTIKPMAIAVTVGILIGVVTPFLVY